MPRVLKLIALALLAGLVALVVVRLRASRAPSAGLDSTGELPGSFDNWPEVPRKEATAA